MSSRVYTFLMFVFGLTLAFFVKHWTDTRGLPAIESSVDGQLGN
jgi:hypothetical protein